MKTIIYILLVVMLSGVFIPTHPKQKPQPTRTVTLQSTSPNVSAAELNQSAGIIKKRLLAVGLNHFILVPDPAQATLTVRFENPKDSQRAGELLTAKGHLGFAETVDRSEVLSQLSKSDRLLSLMDIPAADAKNITTDVFGYAKPANMEAVNAYLATAPWSQKLSGKMQFVWGNVPNDKHQMVLYILKQPEALTGSAVSEATATDGQPSVQITFNEAGRKTWQELTRRNIGKPLAIVIDNRVYFAPVVRDEIKGGKSNITGNFTRDELTRLAALINNGELPVGFRMVK